MTTITLEIRKQNQASKTLTFSDGKYIIGRDSGDIVMGDTLVSSKHAEITVENGSVTFTDLNSTNGSFDNAGSRITGPFVFTAGSEIKMGNAKLALVKIDAPGLQAKTQLAPAMPQPPSSEPAAPLVQAQPAAQSQSPGSNATGATGLWGTLMEMLKYARETLEPHIVQVVKPILILTLPLPLILDVLGMAAFIVPVLGVALFLIIATLSLLLTLPITIALVLFVYPVAARFIISIYKGTPSTMKEGWVQYKQNLSANVLNTFVTTLIGGLTMGFMGMFVFQVPPIEDKKMLDVNIRCWELFKLSWKKVSIAVIGPAVLFFVPAQILSIILAFVPFIGGIASTILLGVVSAIYFAVVMLLLTRIYFETAK